VAPTIFGRDDIDMFVELAGCSLDESPGSNWVQKSGGLPEYICEIARAIHRGGKTVSQSIAIAVSRVKKWPAGVGVDKDTQAKAAKALAEWEALKAKNKGKTGAKKSAHALAASAGYGQILCLTDYNMDSVRSAFQNRNSEVRREWSKANPNANYEAGPPYLYVKEVWNSFVIVYSDYGRDADMWKVPYTVDDKGDITFGDAVEVKTQYIEITDDDLGDDVGDDATLASIAAMTCTSRVQQAHRPAGTALSRVLTLSEAAALDEPETAETAQPEPPLPVGGTPVAVPEYADPGHQDDEKPRYALKTPAQIKAAWAMINQTLNAKKYQAWQLAHIKANIQAAAHHKDVDLTALSAALDAHPAVARILALSAEE